MFVWNQLWPVEGRPQKGPKSCVGIKIFISMVFSEFFHTEKKEKKIQKDKKTLPFSVIHFDI